MGTALGAGEWARGAERHSCPARAAQRPHREPAIPLGKRVGAATPPLLPRRPGTGPLELGLSSTCRAETKAKPLLTAEPAGTHVVILQTEGPPNPQAPLSPHHPSYHSFHCSFAAKRRCPRALLRSAPSPNPLQSGLSPELILSSRVPPPAGTRRVSTPPPGHSRVSSPPLSVLASSLPATSPSLRLRPRCPRWGLHRHSSCGLSTWMSNGNRYGQRPG